MRTLINVSFIILCCFAIKLQNMGCWRQAAYVMSLEVIMLLLERHAVHYQSHKTLIVR